MKRRNLEKIKMSDKKIVTFDKAAPTRIYTKSPSKLRSESPVDKMNPETIQNKESVKLEEEKQPNKFKELKRSRITALKAFNKNALKRRQIVRNKKNCVLIDVDPRVWKKNKSNWIPLIKYWGQENDEHLLYLSKYIRWLFKIGKYNSMSSESGSISSLSLFRKLNSRIGESNYQTFSILYAPKYGLNFGTTLFWHSFALIQWFLRSYLVYKLSTASFCELDRGKSSVNTICYN